MKLYGKVFIPLALSVLVSMVLMAWVAGRVLPGQLRARQAQIAESFQRRVEALAYPTPDRVLFLADSMGVRVRLIPEDGRMARRQEPPPLPGTVVIPPRPGFPFTVVGMVPLPGARGSLVILGAGVLLLLQAGVLHLVLRGAFSRIERLERAATLLGAGDLAVRYDAGGGGGDELDRLGERFNAMAGRIGRLVASHKELLGSVAHELRTPLARISLALELLREGPEPREEMLLRIENDLHALNDLLSELLEYNRLGRQNPPDLRPSDLRLLADEVIAEVAWTEKGAEVEVSGEARVLTDREMVRRVLANLVTNAVRYAVSRVVVEIRPEAPGARMSVTDDGPGFPPVLLAGAFEPFRKGKDSPGTGLGLSIARRIVELLGGEISAENLPGGGARVTFTLPG